MFLFFQALRRACRLSKFASLPLPSSRPSTCFTLLLELPSLRPSRRQLNTLLHQIWSVATLQLALILLSQVGIWPLALNAPLNSAASRRPSRGQPARGPWRTIPWNGQREAQINGKREYNLSLSLIIHSPVKSGSVINIQHRIIHFFRVYSYVLICTYSCWCERWRLFLEVFNFSRTNIFHKKIFLTKIIRCVYFEIPQRYT